MLSNKTCPFAEIIAPNHAAASLSVNPMQRRGDFECKLSQCKFNEGGQRCRIVLTCDLERENNMLLRKLAKRMGVTL